MSGLRSWKWRKWVKLSEETKKATPALNTQKTPPTEIHDQRKIMTTSQTEQKYSEPESRTQQNWESKKSRHLCHRGDPRPRRQQSKKSPEEKAHSVAEMTHTFPSRQPRGSCLLWVNYKIIRTHFNNKVWDSPEGWGGGRSKREIRQVWNLSIHLVSGIIKSSFPLYTIL